MRKYLSWIIAVLALVVLVGGFIWYQNTPGRLDDFAKCLGEKKAVFYGAYWCKYCQRQKAMFGKSAKKLPYTECSTPDGRGQLKVCKDKKIESYPIWEFKDKSRLGGVVELEDLAEKTGCELPE